MKTSSFMTIGYNRGTERIDPRPSKRVGRCSPTLACRLSRAARGREASHGASLHGSTPPATGETPALPYASAVGEHSPAEGSELLLAMPQDDGDFERFQAGVTAHDDAI